MPNLRLTDLTIKSLKPPSRGQLTYWDRSLGLRISQGGSKTFVVLAGSGRRRALGRYPDVSLAEAKHKAKLFTGTAATVSVSDAVDLFVETHCKQKNKPSTAKETERLLRAHLGHLRTLDTPPRQLVTIFDRLAAETPSTANHAFTAARTFYRWCERRTYISQNPMRVLQMPAKNNTRDRVLSNEELKAIWHTCEGTFGDIVRMLMLTGQRRGETRSIEAEWLNTTKRSITFPRNATKNGREHTIPYGDITESVLKMRPDSGLLFRARGLETAFSGFMKCKLALDEESGVTDWTLHDLRRTFATNIAELGVPPHVLERLLNHATGTISGVAAVYNRFAYKDEMRNAVELWETRLWQIINSN
jgi:integrase